MVQFYDGIPLTPIFPACRDRSPCREVRFTFPRRPERSARGRPLIGEHTEEVLTEAGYSSAEIEALRIAEII